MSTPMTNDEILHLERLETALWDPEKRFDRVYMEQVLAADFFEFGRSGRAYNRRDTIDVPAGPIDVHLPLINFQARLLSENVAQVTYISEATYDGVLERSRRSSIWSRTADGWVMRFHQGTVIPDDTAY